MPMDTSLAPIGHHLRKLCLPKLWKSPEEPQVKHPLGIKRVFEVGIVAPNFTNLVKLTPHLNTLSDP